MNIACISTARVPSDTANSIQVMKVCQAMARLGHAVTLIVPGRQPAAWAQLAEQYGLGQEFSIHWLPASPRWKNNDFAFSAVRHARKLRPHSIYTWTGQSAVFALLAGMPVIYEGHDRPTGRLGPLWLRALLRLPGKKRLALITSALRQVLERQFGPLPDHQVVIAPNGVDLEAYAALPDPVSARRALGWPELPTVLCSGHLYAGRGVDLFLALAQRFPQASFVWVGGRPTDVEQYRQRAAALPNVRFTGFIPQRELPVYQAGADVLLMPYARAVAGSSGGNSADICSPMKMFDYLAVGRAILSSDLPVIHEVLDHSTARFAVPEDIESWSAALGALLSDGTLTQKLGHAARQAAQAYSWRARAERVLAGWQ